MSIERGADMYANKGERPKPPTNKRTRIERGRLHYLAQHGDEEARTTLKRLGLDVPDHPAADDL